MEPSGPKIKHFLIFSPKKVFLDFDKWNFLYSQSELSELKKIKKNHSEKKFLYSRKWNFLASYFSYISGNATFRPEPSKSFPEKNFLFFYLKKPAMKKFLIFRGIKLPSLKSLKNFLMFSLKKFFL